MLTRRPANERGHANHGWLDTRHTFSFAGYYDPGHMGFRSLRVLNEDRVAPGAGFGTHPHRDMEILTYVLEGALAHKDSMGTGSVIRPGEVQKMTAGTGVTHSEMNPSPAESVHFLQIWIEPRARGLKPSYEQKAFPPADRRGQPRLLASSDGREGSITIAQDVSLHGVLLAADEAVALALAHGRHAWVQIASGAVEVNDTVLTAGDGAALSGETRIAIRGKHGVADVLLFDLA